MCFFLPVNATCNPVDVMVIMPGGISVGMAPPTTYALKMRPWLLAVFGALLPVAVARFFMFDLLGGFFLSLIAFAGWFAMREGIDVAWLLVLAVILLLNAVFDAFIVLLRAVHLHGALFSSQLPWLAIVLRVLVFAGPVLELVVACLCWQVYKDHLDHIDADAVQFLGHSSFRGAGAGLGGGYGTAGRPTSAQAEDVLARGGPGAQRPNQSWKAFGGEGHRLTA